MLNKVQLSELITAATGKFKLSEITSILQFNTFNLRDLVDLTLYEHKKTALRAAWLLENVFLQKPNVYLNDLEYLIGNLKLIKYERCKRHYAKIAVHITSPKAHPAVKSALLNINLEPVTNQCFEWLVDPKVLIAVKSFAAEALFNMRHRYTWISEELAEQLAYLMRNSPAMQNKGEKLLGYLHPLTYKGV